MYNPDMIIYGEILFIENMLIGGVLLYLTGEICGRSWGWFRLAVGGIMCGLFSLVIFLGAKAPLMMLMEAVFAACVCTVVFGCKGCSNKKKTVLMRLPWRHAVVFILVTYFMGGITMGLLLLTKQQGVYTAIGIYTGDMKAAMLAVFIALGYITTIKIIKTVKNMKLYTEHIYDVRIEWGKGAIEVKGFLDTGNHLSEPVTGKPVAVASEELWHHMQRCGLAPQKRAEDMHIYDEAVRRFTLIPYETVGTKGVLEAVRVDNVVVGTRSIKGCYIAASDGSFSIGHSGSPGVAGEYTAGQPGQCELLLSARMADTYN